MTNSFEDNESMVCQSQLEENNINVDNSGLKKKALKDFYQGMISLSWVSKVKPHVSESKMTSITESAIRATKFYENVVRNVEVVNEGRRK